MESKNSTPKYPKNLGTILEVNSNSSPEDRQKEGWIMSVSKSFCATTGVLMAADGKFGENKMNASLLDVLNEAEKNHPESKERKETIDAYRAMIQKKGCGNITMSELLSHRSGLTASNDYLTPGNLKRLEALDSKMSFNNEGKDAKHNYCNPGFVLAEEIMSLASDSGDYYTELQNRIINPLNLTHTKSIYESEESKKTASEAVYIKDVIYDWGIVWSKETARLNPLNKTQTGEIALSEGGLCSNIGDLEAAFTEISKMVCGLPNLLQSDPEKTKEIHQFYIDAHNAAKKIKSDSQMPLHIHAARHYALGLIIDSGINNKSGEIASISEQGNVISVDEKEALVRIWHIGGGPGNDAGASVTMPLSFEEFISGRSCDLKGQSPTLDVYISQQDTLAKDSLLTIVSCDYISKIEEYFSGKCDQKTDKHYNAVESGYNWRQWYLYNNDQAARSGKDTAIAWQADLISEGRLPKNFPEFHAEIRAAYATAQKALEEYVVENFFTNGIIDSEKVKKLQTAEDFAMIRKEIGSQLSEAQAKVADVFERSDQQLAIENRAVVGEFTADVLAKEEAAANKAKGVVSEH